MYCWCSVAQLCPALQPHWLQHARLPCLSPSPRACSNSCPLSRWCHPTISSSVLPFSSCPQSFPASGSFPVSQLFASGGQSIGVSASASVLPMTIQDWPPLGWPGWPQGPKWPASCCTSPSTLHFVRSAPAPPASLSSSRHVRQAWTQALVPINSFGLECGSSLRFQKGSLLLSPPGHG